MQNVHGTVLRRTVVGFSNVTEKGKNVKMIQILTSRFKFLDEGKLLADGFETNYTKLYKTNKNILSNLNFVLVASLTTIARSRHIDYHQ